MRDRRSLRARAASAIAGAAVVFLPVEAMAQRPQKAQFDIPADDLGVALTTLARQSKREIYFSSDLTRGRRAPRLRGQWTVQQALQRLLVSSGLSYRLNPDGSIVVETAPENGAPRAEGAPAAEPQWSN